MCHVPCSDHNCSQMMMMMISIGVLTLIGALASAKADSIDDKVIAAMTSNNIRGASVVFHDKVRLVGCDFMSIQQHTLTHFANKEALVETCDPSLW